MEAVAGFPRYDQYKDSGVEWLGEIPPDWGLTKLRYEMQLINGAAFKPSDWGHEGIPIVRIQNLNGGEVYNYVKPSRKVDPKYHLEKGDLVFSWSGNVGTSFGAFRWENEFKAYLNQHIFKITAYKNYSDRFLYWLLKAVTTEVEANTHGIFGLVHITKGELGSTILPVVPEDTQKRIASFLDQKTAEIDAAMSKKQRLIELLKEQKAILINQAVTQGLDPNVPMYDSGVEWIGQVPEHWEVLQNRRGLRKIEQGSSPSLNNDIQDDTYSVLKLSAVKSGIYIDHEYKPIPKKFFRRAYQVKKGDFLMTRGNTPELVADICYVKDDPVGQVMMPDLVYRLEYDESIFDKEFVAYFFQSKPAREQIKLSARGSSPTMVKVSQDHIKSWLVPVPPLVEQRRIRIYLDKAVAEIGAPIEQTNQQIQMLGELKSVLISEAVTGKIKL